MRSLFASVVAGLAVAAAAVADDPVPAKKVEPPAKAKAAPKKKAEPSLKVGDKAPELKADKWLQGDEVKGFEAGKVYVVEFWQTWCGPCIVAMPHLADLAEEYKPKGVTVVGFAGVLGRDTTEKIEAFVKKKGPKLGYTFAHTPDSVVTDAWMTAAGQNGIPCSFVVDQQGKIAYIGHPMTLDPVLPKVVDGTWDPAKADEVMTAYRKDQQALFAAAGTARSPSQAAEALKKLADLTADKPGLASNPNLPAIRLGLMIRAEQFTEAAAAAEAAIAKAVKRDDGNKLSGLVATLSAVKNPVLSKLAVKAADANLQSAGDGNVAALMTAQTAYAAAGETEKAKEFATKAVGLAEKAVRGDDDWQGRLRLAAAYKAAGQPDKAKEAAQKALDTVDELVKNKKGPPAMRDYAVQQAKQYGAEPKKDEDKDK